MRNGQNGICEMDEQGVIEKLSKIKLFHTVKDDEERLTKLARIVTW